MNHKSNHQAKRSEKWYAARLSKYFLAHYAEYDKTAEWYNNPAPNQWKFELPGDGKAIILICDESGNVHEMGDSHDESV